QEVSVGVGVLGRVVITHRPLGGDLGPQLQRKTLGVGEVLTDPQPGDFPLGVLHHRPRRVHDCPQARVDVAEFDGDVDPLQSVRPTLRDAQLTGSVTQRVVLALFHLRGEFDTDESVSDDLGVLPIQGATTVVQTGDAHDVRTDKTWADSHELAFRNPEFRARPTASRLLPASPGDLQEHSSSSWGSGIKSAIRYRFVVAAAAAHGQSTTYTRSTRSNGMFVAVSNVCCSTISERRIVT